MQAAVDGDPFDWDALMRDFGAAIDRPVCGFWSETAGNQLCTAFGVPAPDVSFPHVDKTDEFRAITGLD